MGMDADLAAIHRFQQQFAIYLRYHGVHETAEISPVSFQCLTPVSLQCVTEGQQNELAEVVGVVSI
jgi:hypothetical protein